MSVPASRLLRADLESAQLNVATVTALWGDAAESALHRGQRVPARRALDAQPPSRAGTLARLFILGDPVPAADLAAALPTLGIEGAVELELVRLEDGRVEPVADLRPYSFADSLGSGSWWIVSDPGEMVLGRPLDEDHVLGVGGASLTLSGLMLQTEVDSILDLGTGCGIQALHASRFARRVVATDISERALRLARLNADLNGVQNIEFRVGSLWDPVDGERFDRIVSNPPFVITPRRPEVPAYEYRDGGMTGDGIVQRVVEGCAAHLRPGGTVQTLGNWEYRADGRSGTDRVREWTDAGGTDGLDAWIVEREVQSPEEYAETWIRDGGTREGSTAFDRLYDAWLDDFSDRGVQAVGFGYLILRRPDAQNRSPWNRTERLQTPLTAEGTALGVHIAACLVGRDAEAECDDDALAEARLVTAEDITEERHFRPGEDDPAVILLRQGSGFARSVPVDTALSAFVGACDGELTAGAIIGALSQLLEVDESALRDRLLPQVRELIDTAMLQMVGADPHTRDGV